MSTAAVLEPRKIAFITGASSGIGLELARVFAREKHDVILVARSAEKLAAVARELAEKFGVRAWAWAADLTRAADLDGIFQRLRSEKLNVDVLVNNAGFGEYGPFAETDWSRENQMIQLNVAAVVKLTKHFASEMKRLGRGKILQISSTAAFQPGPFMAVYFATKSFVLSFSEAIACELKGSGVQVTTVCPGPTRTGFEFAPGMTGSHLFRNRRLPEGEAVAEFAYRALLRGKTVAVHGYWNRFLSFVGRWVPRAFATRVARKIIRGA